MIGPLMSLFLSFLRIVSCTDQSSYSETPHQEKVFLGSENHSYQKPPLGMAPRENKYEGGQYANAKNSAVGYIERERSARLVQEIDSVESSRLISSSNRSVCNQENDECHSVIVVSFPFEEMFQQGSGSPSEPIELTGVVEFYESNHCLKQFVAEIEDLRNNNRSGCDETQIDAVVVSDGRPFVFNLNSGLYYVRIRGLDGAPHSHLIFDYRKDRAFFQMIVKGAKLSASEN